MERVAGTHSYGARDPVALVRQLRRRRPKGGQISSTPPQECAWKVGGSLPFAGGCLPFPSPVGRLKSRQEKHLCTLGGGVNALGLPLLRPAREPAPSSAREDAVGSGTRSLRSLGARPEQSIPDGVEP